MNCYLAGSLVRVATYTGTVAKPIGGFRNEQGILVDPVTVTFSYQAGQAPVQVITFPAPPLTKDGAGLYHADLDTTGMTGLWTYVWDGVGLIQAIAKNSFVVQAPFA